MPATSVFGVSRHVQALVQDGFAHSRRSFEPVVMKGGIENKKSGEVAVECVRGAPLGETSLVGPSAVPNVLWSSAPRSGSWLFGCE